MKGKVTTRISVARLMPVLVERRLRTNVNSQDCFFFFFFTEQLRVEETKLNLDYRFSIFSALISLKLEKKLTSKYTS